MLRKAYGIKRVSELQNTENQKLVSEDFHRKQTKVSRTMPKAYVYNSIFQCKYTKWQRIVITVTYVRQKHKHTRKRASEEN